MNGLIEIKSDLFDISRRLKSVKPFYRLYYNNVKKRYEVYDGKSNSMAFAVPYKHLDARTVNYARYTSVGNAARLFADMEKHNAEVSRAEARENAEKLLTKLEDSL